MMILAALLVCAAALEALLLFGKEFILDERKVEELEKSLQQAYGDQREAKTRFDAKRAELLKTVEDRERQTKLIRETDKAFAASQKLLPTLIHTIGQAYDGLRFRATISKELPPMADKNQRLIWDCPNLVEVWSTDLETAQAALAKQFPAKQGYTVGELAIVETKPPAGSPESAEAAA